MGWDGNPCPARTASVGCSPSVGELSLDGVAVDDFDGVEEGHGGAELGSYLFDGVVALGFTVLGEAVAAGLVFVDEFGGEASVLDVGEELLHGGLGGGGDDGGLGFVASPFGGVGDGVVHVLEASAVEEVDDELELVEDFEVGELGLVAGLGEDFKAALDEGGGTTAEDGLLAEEVGFGLFGEGGFEDSSAGSADALGVAESEGEGGAAGILLDGDEGWDSSSFGEATMPRPTARPCAMA